MTDLFNKCVEVILKNEGGYVNHPNDPGGETNFGIAKRYFPNEDIKNMTEERAKEIYYSKYWFPMRLEGINSYEAVLQLFDFGVNAGKTRAIKTAQSLVEVIPDGICGRRTRDAINNYRGDFVKDYKAHRRGYYERLAERKPRMRVFLKGWLNRVEHTHL